jgi:hypothetical protein
MRRTGKGTESFKEKQIKQSIEKLNSFTPQICGSVPYPGWRLEESLIEPGTVL